MQWVILLGVFFIFAVIRFLMTEKYTRALDDAYISTRNARRVASYFHVCSPGSMEDCDRGTYPFDGLPIA